MSKTAKEKHVKKRMFRIGDRVVKNPHTWIPNDFDSWGRGIGIGIVIEPPFPMHDDEVDVRWPAGRCFEDTIQLLPAPTSRRKRSLLARRQEAAMKVLLRRRS